MFKNIFKKLFFVFKIFNMKLFEIFYRVNKVKAFSETDNTALSKFIAEMANSTNIYTKLTLQKILIYLKLNSQKPREYKKRFHFYCAFIK